MTGRERRELEDGEPLPELFTATRWRQVIAELGLTKRQGEVAQLICRGFSNKQIADQLKRSPSIIRGHTDKLYRRLKVHTRVSVVVKIVLAERRL